MTGIDSESTVTLDKPASTPAAEQGGSKREPVHPARRRWTRQSARKKAKKATLRRQVRLLRATVAVLVGAFLLAVVAIAVLGWSWGDRGSEIAGRNAQAAQERAASKVADDYVTRSLNYSFNDPDGFVNSMKSGTSPALAARYDTAADLIKGVLTQAQVTSNGKILLTHLTGKEDGTYKFIVVGDQSSQNAQNAEPASAQVVLSVSVNKSGDEWIVSDFGVTDTEGGAGGILPGAAPK